MTTDAHAKLRRNRWRERLHETLRHYYEFGAPEAHRFRYSLTFDLVTILFIVITSFLPRTTRRRSLKSCNSRFFIFIITGIVYETQHVINPQINNYADALYFTVTALTTTGFGDITLAGTSGRLISVVIMVLGVTLFLNLVRALLQPSKVRFSCPSCGLQRHDFNAVHCKACGTLLNIPDEG